MGISEKKTSHEKQKLTKFFAIQLGVAASEEVLECTRYRWFGRLRHFNALKVGCKFANNYVKHNF